MFLNRWSFDSTVPETSFTQNMNTQKRTLCAALFAATAVFPLFLQAAEDETCACHGEPPETLAVTLMGEFEKVGVYRLPLDSTLVQAIASAGGFTEKADQSAVRLVRNEAEDQVTAHDVDVEGLLRGDARDWPLRDRDLIVASDSAPETPAPEQTQAGQDSPDITGTWIATEVVEAGGTIFGPDEGLEFIFRRDGLFRFRVSGKAEMKVQGEKATSVAGTYAVEGDRIELTANESVESDTHAFSLDGDVLRIDFDEHAVEFRRKELRMQAAGEFPMGAFPQSVALADVNGDGHSDVLTANREDDSATVRLGAGDGTFGDPVHYATDPEPLFVRAADLDGDDRPELITANFSNTVTVFPAKGDGMFGEPRSHSAGEGDLMPINVVAADFTGDGLTDLATANFMGNSVTLLAGKGNLAFAEPELISVGDGPVSIVTADLNQDGDADLAVANRRESTATILLGNGEGAFAANEVEIGEKAGFIAAGDLTNDGIIDLAVPNYRDHSVSLLFGDDEGGFTRRELDVEMCTPSSLALGDVDGDGWLDVVAVCQGLGGVAVFLNGGDASFFAPPIGFHTEFGSDAAALGDLNGDGLADVVTASLGGGSVSVLLSGEGEAGTSVAEIGSNPIVQDGEATLVVEFETPEGVPVEFEKVQVLVMDGERPSIPDALKFTSKNESFEATFENLRTGHYLIYVFTGSGWEEMDDAARPGAFHSRERVTLDGSSDVVTHTVRYQRFDPESVRGTARAEGEVLDIEGNAVSGLELRARFSHRTAGRLDVETTRTDENGRFRFEKLAEGATYSIIYDEWEDLGTISAGDDITLTMAPQVGQTAPDIEFIHLASGETRKLSDFRGKVVLVDFWASWCGPCQEPMEKMQHYRDQNPDWGEGVELIALSIDDTRRAAELHLENKGWNKSYNAWAGDGGFKAKPAKAFRINGVPTAYLIDQEGNVAATGHPSSMDIPALINGLLKKSAKSGG